MNTEETSLATGLPQMVRPESGSQITSLATGNTYTFHSKLGEGFFSEVYACTDVWNNELAAKILKPRLPVERMRDAATREFTTLLTVRNPYVTHTFDAFEFASNFFIVTERCLNTVDSIFDIQDFNGMLWLMPIARCLLQAVQSLHVMGIAHQDIHLGNVMSFTQKDEMLPDRQAVWRFKLCDLGIARLLTDLAATELRKRSITPPEVLNTAIYGPLDHRIDIYHTGLILLQLARSERLVS
jgi:serine/threonine protein kinase